MNQSPLLRGLFKHDLFGVPQVNNWCTCNEDIELGVELCTLRQLRKHLRCALRVANIRKFGVFSLLEHVIDLCRSIIFTKLIKAVVKECLVVPNRVKVGVPSTVNVSTVVAEPNIVALFG